MKYDVRYQIGGEEQSTAVEADDAATAVSSVQEQFLDSSDVFELIQVQLLEDFPRLEVEPDDTGATA